MTRGTGAQKRPPEKQPPNASSPPLEERRQFPRTRVLKLGAAQLGDGEQRCNLVDLSEGGAKLRTKEPNDYPDVFELRMASSERHLCGIAWRGKGRIGVQFLDGLAPISTAEDGRRRSARTASFRHGLIACDHHWAMACKVMDLSAGGARLQLKDIAAGPDTFDLWVNYGPARHCRVAWREGREMGVQYLGEPQAVGVFRQRDGDARENAGI